ALSMQHLGNVTNECPETRVYLAEPVVTIPKMG
ncbi:MAG: hypothetical protein ACI9RO_001210, partial [Alteromonas macleodii]